MDESIRQHVLDVEHLRLLRIGYFIQGGVTSVMALFGLLYVFMGLLASSFFANAPGNSGAPPPPFVGYFLALFGALFMLAGGTFAALQFLTARALGHHQSRTLSLITAGLTCVFLPYGTALGICTFMVLGRPSVRTLFNGGPPANP